ncbi:ribosomal protein L37E [Salimicrobium jeotgali]|nr:ribosomal protein L37E [Salimicrobium jeotgali]
MEDVNEKCEECGKKLDPNDEYHQRWGTCDSCCYGVLVGVYPPPINTPYKG